MTIFTGTSGDDILPPIGQNNSGDDTFYGLAGADQISAGIGNDIVYGGSEADVIDGGGGDDFLSGGTGDDTLIGNFGDDTYIVDWHGDTVTEYSASDGTDTIYSAVSYTLPQHVERLILTGSWNTSATGGEGADILVGNSGANTLTGNGGADLLSGGDGNDVLRGGAGPDAYDGGNGIDAITYTESGMGVYVNLTTGLGLWGALGETFTSIENVNGSSGNDQLDGDSGDNVLNGWAGKDTLTGGGGADRFVFSSLVHTVVGAADSITDFDRAQGDLIDLSQIDADTTVAGNQAFTFIGTGLYTGQAGELRYAHVYPGNHTIAGDVNGDGISDFHISMWFISGLVAGDFVL
ncbi:calcium-binding protein [Inquilinus sp. OTU3971]|uniref:calcium-binding protein n=1 Tax=Inquilinus sp. OTU3971 TaxID=3043855 RepID=UPI00313B7E46